MRFPRRGVSALAASTLISALVLLAAPHANAAETLLSAGRPVTASSTESSAVPAAAAVDGNTGTRWSSAFTASQWFQVDLGAPAAVGHVAIDWEAAYAKAFSIQLSTDGVSYSTAYSTTAGVGGRPDVTVTGTARYVKVLLTTRALTAYGYSFWELRVYGAAGPTPAKAGIGALALVNDLTHQPILGLSPLVDGSVVDLTRLAGRNLSLRATLAAGVAAGSVTFQLTGAKGTTLSRTENTAPYFLCNDYVDCPLLATPDTYTLTVQAYSAADAAARRPERPRRSTSPSPPRRLPRPRSTSSTSATV
ncbi:hypothetical protein GCM10010172_02720 [Paractinoplanes ferrugineus]|uniref:F5/8 type C domain-containing protein n=1 Tax=Paractinoplanes ferrugineus TaxID=113564 RepID=A0A919J5F1_9ACTN|nr:discoidin domain-containing protein [Actinoplanes ferrugineus]GIE13677.1 hypothetical protein Afe05nite_55170 [Actinoplanes ferrugineus]